VDSIYFSVVTMDTAGYGDIHPQFAVGKILALIIAVDSLLKTFIHLTVENYDIC
jgi:voltage-gated potassium channel Kch